MSVIGWFYNRVRTAFLIIAYYGVLLAVNTKKLVAVDNFGSKNNALDLNLLSASKNSVSSQPPCSSLDNVDTLSISFCASFKLGISFCLSLYKLHVWHCFLHQYLLLLYYFEVSRLVPIWSRSVWSFLLVRGILFWEQEEMLGLFNKGLVQPPQELNSPAPLSSSLKPKLSQEILKDFVSHSTNAFSVSFGNATSLAYLPQEKPYSTHQRYLSLSPLSYVLSNGRACKCG